MLYWGEIYKAMKWSHSGYWAVRHKDNFFRCDFLDDKQGCVHTCICKEQPGSKLVDGDKVVCRIQPQEGMRNVGYEDLPIQKVPIFSEVVL